MTRVINGVACSATPVARGSYVAILCSSMASLASPLLSLPMRNGLLEAWQPNPDGSRHPIRKVYRVDEYSRCVAHLDAEEELRMLAYLARRDDQLACIVVNCWETEYDPDDPAIANLLWQGETTMLQMDSAKSAFEGVPA